MHTHTHSHTRTHTHTHTQTHAHAHAPSRTRTRTQTHSCREECGTCVSVKLHRECIYPTTEYESDPNQGAKLSARVSSSERESLSACGDLRLSFPRVRGRKQLRAQAQARVAADPWAPHSTPHNRLSPLSAPRPEYSSAYPLSAAEIPDASRNIQPSAPSVPPRNPRLHRV